LHNQQRLFDLQFQQKLGKVTVQILDVVFIKYPLPAVAVRVEPVTTAVDQSRPPGVAAITPEALNTLLVTVPLIIFSYAVNEYPAAEISYLAVPTPDTSAATTPELFTKLDIATGEAT
jgi:hypothetical protein